MPIASWIPPGVTAPLLRISWVPNLGHNFANSNNRNFQDLACPAGVEPATYGLEGRCSIQLSYGQLVWLILMDYLSPRALLGNLLNSCYK